MHRIFEKFKSKGIAIKQLPPEFVLPFIEAAGNVSDETLQEMWANLLASAVNDPEDARVSYVKLLDQLDAPDAKVLHFIAKHGKALSKEEALEESLKQHAINDDMSFRCFFVSVARLNSLGLVSVYCEDESEGKYSIWLTNFGRSTLSAYGVAVESECHDTWSLLYYVEDNVEAIESVLKETISEVAFEQKGEKQRVERLIRENTVSLE